MDEIEELSADRKKLLEEKHVELVKIIQSFENLEKSKEWETLKEFVFSKALSSIERQLLNESLAPKIDTDKLYKLQGQYEWARKFNDFDRFTETLKKQLEEINKKIK